MELRTLKTFQVVATHLNQTKAAEILGYTQPTITMHIRNLEQEIGHPLFHRVGKKTYLTPAGKVLKQHVDRIMDCVEEMNKALNRLHDPYGTLVIAAPEYYWTHFLTMLIHTFVKLHPQVKLKLVSCNSVDVIQMITAREADVGIITGKNKNEDLEFVSLDEEELLLVIRKDLHQNSDLSAILQTYPLFFKKFSYLDWLFDRCMEEIPTPMAVIESDSEEAIKQAILKGTGVGIISGDLIHEEIRKGELIPLHRFTQTLDTFLITRRDRSDEITIQAFVELVMEGWNEAAEESL
ncbi:DNA-binding transcriptional LysR family regulator [Brevibacillus aydinogluensis]|jgi:DNA-binding transcriptional LysR family regulator|uniref:LysR family transcriptional regulator n=1 Tax=Brevibacillus aydinogluensis TaxID=927786 RepID=UPI000E36CA94|nr:LysR family transcriptional regulator [Brevibacillus aydinogluensis]MDT3417360.1 DNA-binding transcriptional LysR family regulator [Brevibacillus aydinogluensis]REK63105.1 MAG: LysR family transcriptional regulator [Brevibacillus sp.]